MVPLNALSRKCSISPSRIPRWELWSQPLRLVAVMRRFATKNIENNTHRWKELFSTRHNEPVDGYRSAINSISRIGQQDVGAIVAREERRRSETRSAAPTARRSRRHSLGLDQRHDRWRTGKRSSLVQRCGRLDP